jgi:hypothetical protein
MPGSRAFARANTPKRTVQAQSSLRSRGAAASDTTSRGLTHSSHALLLSPSKWTQRSETSNACRRFCREEDHGHSLQATNYRQVWGCS